MTTVETKRESWGTLVQGRRASTACDGGDQKRKRKGERERDDRRERTPIKRDGGSKNPGEGENVPICGAVGETERSRRQNTERGRKRERETVREGANRKRGKDELSSWWRENPTWRKRKSGRERGTRRTSGERERAGPGAREERENHGGF